MELDAWHTHQQSSFRNREKISARRRRQPSIAKVFL